MATIVSTRRLTDYQVLNPLGEQLGKVADVVLDPDLRQARYLVLSFGGLLARGHKLFAVPVGAVHLDTENECLVVDVQRQQLEDAPGFDERSPPAGADPAIERAIYRFEHADPAELDAASSRSSGRR